MAFLNQSSEQSSSTVTLGDGCKTYTHSNMKKPHFIHNIVIITNGPIDELPSYFEGCICIEGELKKSYQELEAPLSCVKNTVQKLGHQPAYYYQVLNPSKSGILLAGLNMNVNYIYEFAEKNAHKKLEAMLDKALSFLEIEFYVKHCIEQTDTLNRMRPKEGMYSSKADMKKAKKALNETLPVYEAGYKNGLLNIQKTFQLYPIEA